MKKIFTFLSILLFAFSSANAQKGYTFVEKSVDEILSGKEHKYVLRQSNNESTLLDGYLSSNNHMGPVTEVDEGCIFNFIKVGETAHMDSTTMVLHKFNIYVLKNELNGKFLGSSNNLYTTIDKAFQFTAQKAVYGKEENWDDWFIYSKSSNGNTADKVTDDGLGSWVLCSPNSRFYMTFRKGQVSFPYFEIYRSHDAWRIYEVQERQMAAIEKLTIVYNQNFKTEVNPENFPVGNSVGCISSQEVYDEYEKVYKEATDAVTNQNFSDERYEEIRLAILDVTKKVNEATVPFKPGFYLLVSENQISALYDPNKDAWSYASLGKSAPSNFSFTNAHYIWEFIESDKEDEYFVQNFKSKRYWGTTRGMDLAFPMAKDKKNVFTIKNVRGPWFKITEKAKMANVGIGGSGYQMTDSTFRQTNAEGKNLWRFDNINPDTLEVLMAPAKQVERNKELAASLKEAKYAFYGTQYENHFTMDGTYAEGSEGSANKDNVLTNSVTDGSDGVLKNAFDNNLNTFYHGQWQDTKAPKEYHWLQIDLGKEVSEFYVKYSQHKQGDVRNMPKKFAVAAPEEGIDPLKDLPFNDTLAFCEATHFYPSNYSIGSYDSATVVEKVVLKKPAQHIRFVVKETRGNLIRGGVGPVWAVSEFRIYDAAETLEDKKYKAVKQEVKDALKNAIDAAASELAKDSATQVTIDNLDKATEDFWNEYTITDKLTDALEYAQMFIDNAVEATGNEAGKIGYFEAGAKSEYQAAVDKVSTEIEGKILTEADVDNYLKELNDAKDIFYSKFVTIQANGIYQIVCRAGYDGDNNEYAQNDACLASANADITAGPTWKYKHFEGTEGRLNTLWYVEKSEEGYSFKNLANGLYLNNVFEGLEGEELEKANDSLDIAFRTVHYSTTPKHFQMRPAVQGGQVMLALKDNQFLALRNDNQRNVVHYYTPDNAPAQFEMIEVSDDNFDITSLAFDAATGKIQIFTLPFDIVYAATSAENPAHKVIGLNGKYIRLGLYEDGEIIPAGCPFIVETLPLSEETNDNSVIVESSCTSLKDMVNMEYNYTPYSQNGLVSAPTGFELEEGYGFLFNKMVLISSGGEFVKSGTGFFDKTIPPTEEEGVELMLEVDGVIEGDSSTGVGQMNVVKNVDGDVYSISGMKVKDSVKTAEAARGLAKGVYIMNGKKFIVK